MMNYYISRFLKRFKDDENASLTVEFVMILPVLMTWFIGSIVFFDAFNSKASAQRTAHTIADIMSRQSTTSNSYIDSMLVLQNRMLPREGVGEVRISSLLKDAAGDLTLLWTYSTDAAATPLTITDIPASRIPTISNGESILFVETSVPFRPIAQWVGFTVTAWQNIVPIKPRFVGTLPNTDFP